METQCEIKIVPFMSGLWFCRQIYKGYVDDPRNTDNAWIETIAMNFHDDTGEILDDVLLKVCILITSITACI